MIGLVLRLVAWDTLRKWPRLLLMIMAMTSTFIVYVFFGFVLEDMASRVGEVWSSAESSYYRLVVRGSVGEVEESIARMRSVERVDKIECVRVLVGSGSHWLMAPEAGTLFLFDMAEGRLPISSDEVAVPESWAKTMSLKLGDAVNITAYEVGAAMKTFNVSGILKSSFTNPWEGVVLQEAISLLKTGQTKEHELYVALDDSADPEQVANIIKGLSTQVTVSSPYGEMGIGIDSSLFLAEGLLSSMRFLILVIAATSMGVLTQLSYREQGYVNGVLRAMGFTRRWLFVTPVIQGAIVLTLGITLSYCVLLLFSSHVAVINAGLSNHTFAKQAVMYGAAGMAINIAFVHSLSQRPITDLLRDSWAK